MSSQVLPSRALNMQFIKVITTFLSFLFFSYSVTTAAKPPAEYVDKYKNFAITEMSNSGIPASIILAQGMLESTYGRSELATKAHNHFGIKCHDWQGAKVYHDDDEAQECFRKYTSAFESYRDHSIFLKKKGRYSFLFDLETTDYKGWSKGLKSAGYATDPNYAHNLILLIEKHALYRFDAGVPFSQEEFELQKQQEELEEMFYYNRIKTVMTISGVSPQVVADAYGVDVKRICKWNEYNRLDFIPPNTKVFLQPKRKKGPPGKSFHLVEGSETMHEISQMYGIKLRSLYKMNKMIDGSQPDIGEMVALRGQVKNAPKERSNPDIRPPYHYTKPTPKRDNAPTKPYNIPVPNEKVTPTSETEVPTPTVRENGKIRIKELYHVQAGDTLYSIAQQYEISMEELKGMNELSSNVIKIGDKLIVPRKVQ